MFVSVDRTCELAGVRVRGNRPHPAFLRPGRVAVGEEHVSVDRPEAKPRTNDV